MNQSDPNFTIGTWVRFRDWDDMEEEFGLTTSGGIDCKYSFSRSMREEGLCGKEFCITKITDGGANAEGHNTRYMVSADMLEPIIDEDVDMTEINDYLKTFSIKE